jgi:nucleotide-binding universal stress UspA family protein
MSYRNILVQVDETPLSATRVAAAADLAARFGATLTGVFLRSDDIPGFVAGDAFSAIVTVEVYVQERNANLAIASTKARASFEEATAGKDLATSWIEINGDDDATVLAAVRRFDLVVFPHVAASNFGTYAISASHIAMGSGGPVLVLPEQGFPIPFGKRVLVAWKESREAARALRDAWPFLVNAEEVHFLSVTRDAPSDFDDILRRNLADHGVRAFHWHGDRNDDMQIGNVIQRHAGRVGAELIVLGLYGHSRMRELLLGGVSRDLMSALPLPLLVSH